MKSWHKVSYIVPKDNTMLISRERLEGQNIRKKEKNKRGKKYSNYKLLLNLQC